MQHVYTWTAADNLYLVALRLYTQAGYGSWSECADQIVQNNFPALLDPVSAKQRPDGSWTSGIVPGTTLVIPYR